MKFIVRRNDGDEEEIYADYCKLEDNGALVFRNTARNMREYPELVKIFAPGIWDEVTPEYPPLHVEEDKSVDIEVRGSDIAQEILRYATSTTTAR